MKAAPTVRRLIRALCCALLLAVLPAAVVTSQAVPPLRSGADVQDLCEQALTSIVNGDFEQGIGVLRPYATSISKEDVDSLEGQLVRQAATIRTSYGDPLGFVLISRENLKDTVMRLVYVVKYQKHIIRWTFIFYRPVASWLLDYFNYDDSIEGLFEHAGQAAPAP